MISDLNALMQYLEEALVIFKVRTLNSRQIPGVWRSLPDRILLKVNVKDFAPIKICIVQVQRIHVGSRDVEPGFQ